MQPLYNGSYTPSKKNPRKQKKSMEMGASNRRPFTEKIFCRHLLPSKKKAETDRQLLLKVPILCLIDVNSNCHNPSKASFCRRKHDIPCNRFTSTKLLSPLDHTLAIAVVVVVVVSYPRRIGKALAVSSISPLSPTPSRQPSLAALLTVFSSLTLQRARGADASRPPFSLRAFQIERNRYSIERIFPWNIFAVRRGWEWGTRK